MKGRVDVVGRAAEVSRKVMRDRVLQHGEGVVAAHDQAQQSLLNHVVGYGVDPRDRAVIVGMLIAMSMRTRYSVAIAAGLLAEAAEESPFLEIGDLP